MRIAVALSSVLAVGLALAAPVPKVEEKLKPATDEQRDEVKSNLKLLGLALHNYHDAVGHFPTDILDAKTKKPLLSWRVQLLPYLDVSDPNSAESQAAQALAVAFKLDEPWDGKTNKSLVEKMPKVFAPTRVKAKPGETFYRGFGGTGAEFAGLFQPGARVAMASITDGTSNTIALIDAGEAVVWTKPETDLPCDPKKELSKLGGMIDGDFYCLRVDGSVATVKRQFDEKVLRAAISRAGGEVIDGKGTFDDE